MHRVENAESLDTKPRGPSAYKETKQELIGRDGHLIVLVWV